MNQFKNLSRGTLVSIINGYLTTTWQSDRIVVFDSKMLWWKKVQESGAQWGQPNWKYNNRHHFHIFLKMIMRISPDHQFFCCVASVSGWVRWEVRLTRAKKQKKKWPGLKEETAGSSLGLGSSLGKKGKKLASEASREVAALSPSQDRRLARFARQYFSFLTPFLPFFTAAEPGPRLGRQKV